MAKRLVVINVHYAPQSFGGATIVAEAVNEHLAKDHGWQVTVITTHVDPSIPPYHLRRYRARGVDLISINLPMEKRYVEEYDNRTMNSLMADLIERLAPDVVHAHAVQRLGCGYFEAIKALGIPLVVTAHDCWWICDRQFMVDLHGRYCYQEEISPERCRYCVDLPDQFENKLESLRENLARADLVLAPSQFQRDLYAANGVPDDRCRVNGNGIYPPGPASVQKSDKLVFGFIGGPGPLKGAPVIVEAFNELAPRDDYILRVVDAAQNVGVSWKDHGFWRVPGQLEFHPAYDLDSIDEFFAGIDVLLFPSQWKESFGLTVREALARDVWVIACSEGGVGEAIVDGENGELIPMTARSDDLRRAIFRCLQQPDRIRSHHNPHKDQIRFFDEQAAELSKMLQELVDAGR